MCSVIDCSKEPTIGHLFWYSVVATMLGIGGYYASCLAICIGLGPMMLVGLLTKNKEPSPLITVVVVGASIIAGLVQLAWWVEWSAFCLILGKSWALAAAPTWKWLYLVVAFFESTSIIGVLASQESQAKKYDKDNEKDNSWIGMGLYWLTCVISFFVFVFRSAWALQILPPFLRFHI